MKNESGKKKCVHTYTPVRSYTRAFVYTPYIYSAFVRSRCSLGGVDRPLPVLSRAPLVALGHHKLWANMHGGSI